MRRELIFVLICPWLLLVAACSITQPAKTPPQPQTRFEMLAPPASVGRYHLQRNQVAIQPVLRHSVLPVYPPRLVHADAEPVTVTVRIVIGRNGKATRIQPIVKSQSGRHYARFVTAVKDAVTQWRFYPYRVQTSKPDGTVSQVPMPVTLRYVFHFVVTHGKPTVRAGRE